MKSANKRNKFFTVLLIVIFVYMFDPYTLVNNKDEYLWNSIGYKYTSLFSEFKVKLALRLGANGSFADDAGHNSLDMAAYKNNAQGAKLIARLFECDALLKSREIAINKEAKDVVMIINQELENRCKKRSAETVLK